MTNLQQLPTIVWILAIFIIVIGPIVLIWLRRNFILGKIKFKTGPVETEFERKSNKSEHPKTQLKSTIDDDSQQEFNRRTQEMNRSKDGLQSMRGKGGVQKQKMNDSPRGKQKMD